MTYVPKLWSADELAAHAFQYRYLIEPVVPAGGVVLCHGKRGIGKTHFALTIAACVNHAGTLFGRYPTSTAGVVYVQADMTHQIQQDRVRLAQTVHTFPDLHFYFPTHLDLLSLGPHSPLVAAVLERKPRLIIWDTLRKLFRGSTNDDDIPSQLYGHARLLFPEATHLFLHHDKKTIVDQGSLDREELFRGSGAWLDDADTGIHLKEVAPGRMQLEFTKVRTAGEQPTVGLTINPFTLLLYATNGEAPGLVRRWRAQHPQGTPDDLRIWLLYTFACSPRIVDELVERERHRWTTTKEES